MNETIRTTVSRAQAHEAGHLGLSLHCPDQAQWAGSYERLVANVLAEIIEDGGPVAVLAHVPDGPGTCTQYAGTCVAVGGRENTSQMLLFDDGDEVEISDTVSVFIP